MRFGLYATGLVWSALIDLSLSVVERNEGARSLVRRQVSLAELPACGQTCYVGALSGAGGCSITDFSCLCQSASFMTPAQNCFQTTCSAQDLNTVMSLSQQVCVTLQVPLYKIPAFASSTFSPLPSLNTSNANTSVTTQTALGNSTSNSTSSAPLATSSPSASPVAGAPSSTSRLVPALLNPNAILRTTIVTVWLVYDFFGIAM